MRCMQRLTGFVLLAWVLRAQSQEPPQYFDPPAFIVAGVTDSSNRGGHGSDPVLRSTDALAKATASLSSAPPAGNSLETALAYQRAAELDPSEDHIFNWGSELLTHRAAEQAIDVFTRGARLFPRSSRMLLGLAVAFYGQGAFGQARERFFAAADLNPDDPTPYLFLGRAQASEISGSDGFVARMERFVRLHPENAWANYYCGLGLLRRSDRAQPLLEKAVRLDPQLGAAWLQLGILYADAGDDPRAIDAWRKAIAADPQLEAAHYRLAQAFRRTGDPDKAKGEIELYDRLSKQSAEALDRERARIKQFVFELRTQPK
jgi:tetratricopeptide (TPR) repeat protein